MENRQYLSVMTVAASSGDIDLTLTTYDATTNITIIASVSGIASSEKESVTAQKIYNQLSIIISQYNATYSGVPSLLPNGPNPTFRLTRTDHCICIFSECQFSLEVTENNTGNIFIIDTVPVLGTVQDAQAFGVLIGQDFTDLTPSQIANLLLIASAEIIGQIKNPIVASTYIFQHWGQWEESVEFDMKPLIYVDNPYIVRPDILTFLTQTETAEPLGVYDFNDKTGWTAFRYAQDVFNSYEPFDDNNDWRISYIAGYKSIPALIKKALIMMTLYIQDASFAGIDQLEGGTFKVKYAKDIDKLKLILLPIRGFFL